jgi:hypothetical protein
MNDSNRNERNGPALSVTIVSTGRISPVSLSTVQSSTNRWPNIVSNSAGASSIASMASCWLAVGQTWKRCSYMDQ